MQTESIGVFQQGGVIMHAQGHLSAWLSYLVGEENSLLLPCSHLILAPRRECYDLVFSRASTRPGMHFIVLVAALPLVESVWTRLSVSMNSNTPCSLSLTKQNGTRGGILDATANCNQTSSLRRLTSSRSNSSTTSLGRIGFFLPFFLPSYT